MTRGSDSKAMKEDQLRPRGVLSGCRVTLTPGADDGREAGDGMTKGSDDACGATLLLGAVAALFVAAPYLSLAAISGASGTFAAAAATAFLVASVLAPFIPTVGAVIGFQWSLYALWFVGYFTVTGSWVTEMTTWSNPDNGLDGFIGALLLLIPMILFGLLVYVVIPVVLGVVGGLLINLPGRLALDAWRTSPFPLWSRFTADTPLPGAAGAVADQQPAAGQFQATRWGAAHRRTADRSLARRQLFLACSAVLHLGIAVGALLLLFAEATDLSSLLPTYLMLLLAALGLAGYQRWLAESLARDVDAWALPLDLYSDVHLHNVELGNQWASRVHPDDLRDGRPLMRSLLQQSESHMDDAQRLAGQAEHESIAAGPGWDPPSQRELLAASTALRRVQRGIKEALDEADEYRADVNLRANHQGHAQLHARIQEDTEIVAAASEVYAAAYRHAWTVLDSLSESAGLPHPDFAPWVDGSYPPGLPPAELPPELAQIMSRTMTQLTEANQSRTSPRIDQPAARRFLDATRLLQRTSALTQAAEVRLTLLEGNDRSHLGVDDLLVDELIQHIRTRSEAQRDLDSWGFGHSPHS